MKKAFFCFIGSVAMTVMNNPLLHAWDSDPPPVDAPEPTTWLLLGTGAAGLAAYRYFMGRTK